MQDPDWQKTKEIFHQTLDLPEHERQEFLAKQDHLVGSEVSRLIASYEELEDFIVDPIFVEIGYGPESYIGKTIGGYKVVSHIGSGGMGQVFRAEKEGLAKTFALKLIKRGMDTDAVLRRFARESSILSRLEHPNIATLLDAGSTTNDLPYFVMEYIEGLSITKYCDVHCLETGERLEIFQKVCNALSHAHRNLVAHRDVKPSNILVTSDGTPKLLDFGIAKLLDSDDFENVTTALHSRMFTPDYASPEQLNGLPITTATDIYSLGIVLYELLCGVRPFKYETKDFQKIAKRSLSTEPVRPSSVVVGELPMVGTHGTQEMPETKPNTGSTGTRSRDPRSLRGDLDNIILKALRKEPERRYRSVQEFSEDIRRFQSGLPVSATADTAFYRLSKFVHRNKIGTAVAAIFLFLSGVSVWQGISAFREREKAEMRFEQVRKLANIVLFEYHDGIARLQGATLIREKMVRDSLDFLDNLSAEDSDNTDLQRDIVKAYRKVGDIQGASDTGNIGETQAALLSYQKAFAIQEKIAEKDPLRTDDQISLGSLHLDIGLQHRSLGDLESAEESFERSLSLFSSLPDDRKKQNALAKTFWNIASLQTAQNNLTGSLENYRKAAELYNTLAVEEPSDTKHLRNLALTSKNIGSVLQLLGDHEKALQHFQISLQIDEEHARSDPDDISAQLDLSFTYGSIASAFRTAKAFQSSIEGFQKAIGIREKIVSADMKNAFAQNALARGYQELGRTFLAQQNHVGAEEQFLRSNRIYQQMSAEDAENVDKKIRLAENLALLGYVKGLRKDLRSSTDHYGESFEIYSTTLKQLKLSTLNQKRFAAAQLDYAEILIVNKQSATALKHLQNTAELLANEQVRKDATEELEKLNRLLATAR